jgi:hypothetical protein
MCLKEDRLSKRNFDLDVLVVVLTLGAFTLPRLWATKRLLVGPKAGAGFEVARVTKVITA